LLTFYSDVLFRHVKSHKGDSAAPSELQGPSHELGSSHEDSVNDMATPNSESSRTENLSSIQCSAGSLKALQQPNQQINSLHGSETSLTSSAQPYTHSSTGVSEQDFIIGPDGIVNQTTAEDWVFQPSSQAYDSFQDIFQGPVQLGNPSARISDHELVSAFASREITSGPTPSQRLYLQDPTAVVSGNENPLPTIQEHQLNSRLSMRGSLTGPRYSCFSPTDELALATAPYDEQIDISRSMDMDMSYWDLPSVAPTSQGPRSLENQEFSRNIPAERYKRTQDCWPIFSRKKHVSCNDLLFCATNCQFENLFSSLSLGVGIEQRHAIKQPKSRRGFDEACRLRLMEEFNIEVQDTSTGFDISSANPSHTSHLQFPPAELLDIALDLYFREFHPAITFIHLPTFSAHATPSSLLFVICLIGLSILGTPGARKFVMRSFPVRIIPLEFHISLIKWAHISAF
jgi:hypothetical protein